LCSNQDNSGGFEDSDDTEPRQDRGDIAAAQVQFRIGEQPELNDNVCQYTTTTEGDILLLV